MSLDLLEPPVKQRATRVVPAPPLSHKRPPDEYVAFGNVQARNGLQERIEIPMLIRALQLPRGGRVLEIGCGRGIALPVLAERLAPSALIGVDIDDALVVAARSHVSERRIDARVIEADVRELPLESRSFDLVIDFGTCYHVSGGTAGSQTALGEIARVLRTGGLFVHETPVAQHLAHPVRSFGRTLPWAQVPSLVRDRSAVLWAVRRKA
ncbi:MAG: class I SAM-dependent methyltransferase [bacterium]